MTRPYNRLPNYVESARLDAIALSLDIRDLAFHQLRALQEGDWPRVVQLNDTIDARARAIQQHMQDMKRQGQPAHSERSAP
jgi:hypothetical protein